MADWIDDFGNKLVNVHEQWTCMKGYCTIHKPSSHHMRSMKQLWRNDRKFMERVCEHAVGHPDPDEIFPGELVHGCDGCCNEKMYLEERSKGIGMTVKIQTVGENIPKYATRGDAGADLVSSEKHVLFAGQRALVKTGIKIAIPEGYVGLVHPRSGLALKHGITVLNAPGTIDAGYRGEVGVILLNTSSQTFFIEPGDRIAQLVIQKVEYAEFVSVETLESTDRGDGGFGSTGVTS